MSKHDDQQIRDVLKQSFPSVNTEPRRDLWPEVLRRLEARPTPVPWYDWALAGLSVMTFVAFPRLVLVFAYHL